MNKLVSKNSVQRFKEGRKIVKALQGIYFPVTVENTTFQYNPYNKSYQGSQKSGQNISYQDIVNAFNNQYESIQKENNKVYRKKGSRTTWTNSNGEQIDLSPKTALNKQNTTDYSWMAKRGIRERTPEKQQKWEAEVKRQENLMKNDLRKGYNSNPVKTVTPVDNYYLKGFENRKDEIAKLGGVRAVQKMLGFTAGNGLDGKWGQNTEEAYQKYLIANAAKTPSLEDTISAAQNQPILSTPTINPSEYTFTESQLSGLEENPYYEPHPELRFNNFDRTQTRQWLRDNGFNPYSLTGAQRKALRMILNGQGTEQDKNLIGLTGGLSEILTNYKYLKQGGNINKLPSRNIVERFKSQRIKK